MVICLGLFERIFCMDIPFITSTDSDVSSQAQIIVKKRLNKMTDNEA